MHGYDQYCPIALALDQLGDRWTLLILRELTLSGDQRFTDLRKNLPGITPALLTERLRTLIDNGLVITRELPPPAARTVYTPTPRGRETIPVLRALVRWGMPLLEPPTAKTKLRPVSAVHAAVSAYYDADAAGEIDERYQLEIDGETFLLSSVRGGGDAAPRPPDLVIEGPAHVLVAVRLGKTNLRDAIAEGVIKKTGSARALRNFQRIFRLS
jgi:DNA-binding HxlR family transcriptional regulator